MWSRRRFLEGKELGVRPFINAAGTYTGVWMMKPGEDKIVATRLRQVLEDKGR